MDKNTLWAIGLCTLVLIASVFVQTTYIMPKQERAQAEQVALQQAEAEEKERIAQEQSSLISASLSDKEGNPEHEAEADLAEEFFTITTNKAKAILTSRGGDIISYQLLEHMDKSTGHGVEMVDNVSDTNRAFSLAFGGTEAAPLNEIFTAKRIDDYTVGFYRTYSVKDDLKNEHEFYLAKLYTFLPDEYAFKLSVTIRSGSDDGYGLNIGGAAYTIRTSPQIGPHYDRKNRYEVREYLALGKNNKKVRKNFSEKYYDTYYEWAGVGGKYFTMLVKPSYPETMMPRVKCSAAAVGDYQNSQILFTRSSISGSNITDEYYIYVGPRSESELVRYNSSDKNGWGLFNAKFNQALRTSGILSPIELAFKWVLSMLNKLAHNWGVSIILLTILLKIILFPLSKKQAVGSVKMQELQPQMQALQEKYKNDQQKLAEETQKLYKKIGYNPMTGCLPMILQMIILISLYNMFNNYFDFRGASFIPGWIDDLSVGDSVWTWNRYIPVISGFTGNSIRILPFIYVATQLLNGKITQYGGAAGNAQTQTQMKMMMYGMPILFFFMFYNAPSGLLLYWLVSNIFQIGQQLVINRIVNSEKAKKAAERPAVVPNKASQTKAAKMGKKKRK
ncbi:MAG: membrane protein insertase YidC [Treponema sp.]|nr:membrane protein insertase YidC [Treponema sp.]